MKSILVAGAAIALAAGSAHASTVLFDNFGPGDSYATDIGMTLSFGGPLGGQVNEAAVAFTVTGGNYMLNSAEFAVIHNWGPDLVYVDIHSDLAGAPGTVIGSSTASGVMPPFEMGPPMMANFAGVMLEDGQQYWLSMRTEQTDALLAWAHNVTDDFGLRAWQVDGGGWNTAFGEPGTDSQRGVFRITATLIPAPGALALFAFAGLARTRRRN